jgi:hypothetical protein
MGVLALSMTAIVYVPGMLLGYGILRSGFLSGVDWTAGQELNGAIDVGWGWIVGFATETLPHPMLFPIGLGVILTSFKLLDRVLPSLDGEKHADAKGHWLKKPWPMFFLGSLAALLTLSVSVALTVLVNYLASLRRGPGTVTVWDSVIGAVGRRVRGQWCLAQTWPERSLQPVWRAEVTRVKFRTATHSVDALQRPRCVVA